MSATTTTRPTLTTTPPVPTANPYEGGRLFTTVNCPTPNCDERVSIPVSGVDGLLCGSSVVMHFGSEHWVRVYAGSNPDRVQYATN